MLFLTTGVMETEAHAATKKVVFLAGTKSHGPGDHEYEKALRLLARCLETSPNLKGYRAEVHLYGWPEDPKTLDDADTIVLYADGSDHNEAAHPFLVGDRLQIIARQMKRGCGLVLLHYATFAPVKRGGPEYLDWVGGFFDYETGNAPNHWYSAIKHCEARPVPATPNHPISQGLAPFDLREEYYYKMRFRENDSRRVPILNVTIPDEPETQTVAWAMQRKDGGRGFAFTGGHPYTNFQVENFRRMLLNAIVWTAQGDVPQGGVQSSVPADIDDIKTLILTGKNHPAHDWRATTPALQEMLARDPRFKVTVWEDPERLASDELHGFHLLIQNYQNWESPSLSAKARANLLRFTQNGGGLVLIHFANGAWRDWPEYSGRISRRVWIDGKSNHDAYGPFRVHVSKPDHLLTRGVGDFDTVDELYCSQVGELPVDPLLTARSNVTGKDEPLAYIYTENKSRVFQTLLGHDAAALRVPAHTEVIRRACAWAANRETLPLPIAATAQPPRAPPVAEKPLPVTTLTNHGLPFPTVRKKDTVDWPNVRSDKGGTRFSTLTQINRSNVKNLQVAWTYQCKDHNPKENTTLECTPIVLDGVMYLTTVRMNIVALDAATGKEFWRFDPKSEGVNRGVAYWSDGSTSSSRRGAGQTANDTRRYLRRFCPP